MLGRNHALYAATSWLAAYPFIAEPIGIDPAHSWSVLGVTTAVAAGAGVVPDLDHPDARPSKHFGPITWIISKAVNSASGGHRLGTHSLLFAVLWGGFAYAAQFWPVGWGRIAAAIVCGLCGSMGLALVGPSLGFRVPATMDILSGLGIGFWVWNYFSAISGALWVLAAGGVIVHIACDMVTKAGVPILFPFTKRRFGLPIFKVGGKGENIVSVLGILAFGVSCWRILVSFPVMVS